MYNVWFLDNTGNKGVVTFADTGSEIVLDDPDEAWELVDQFMRLEEHPRFMWVKEAAHADCRQPDHSVPDYP